MQDKNLCLHKICGTIDVYLYYLGYQIFILGRVIKLQNHHETEEQKIYYKHFYPDAINHMVKNNMTFMEGCKYLPCSIHVARKFCIFNKVAVVDALLHDFSRCEMVVCKVQHQQ